MGSEVGSDGVVVRLESSVSLVSYNNYITQNYGF